MRSDVAFRFVLSQHRSMVVVAQHKANHQEQVRSPSPSSDSETLLNNNDEHDDLRITEACWNRIQQLASKRGQSPDDVFLRLYVDAGGCSGFEYHFEVDDQTALEDDDRIWKGPHGTRLVVDAGSFEFIKGSTIDYVQEMIKSSFEVKDNPQSESACGCGSSFAVKNFQANPASD